MADLKQEFQTSILPVVVTFIVYNVIGFLGNMTVLYIYGFRYPKTRFRYLVIALSFVDFTSCCSTVPMETVSVWFWFEAPSELLCKAKNFSVQFTGLSAMYMLFVTAVCKYRTICRPFGTQMSKVSIIILCGCGLVGSLMCASPAAILWGVNNYTVTDGNHSEDILVCEVQTQYHRTKYPELYRHLLSAYDLFLVATILLYVFVARATITHVMHMKKLQRKHEGLLITRSCSVTSSSQTMFTTETIIEPEKSQSGSDLKTSPTGSRRQTTMRRQNSLTTERMERRTSLITTVNNSRPTLRTTPIQVRKVVIMVVIAGTFSMTFLLALAFGYVFALRNFHDYSSTKELLLLFCFYRFYFINYAMNPVVYFCLDLTYRKELIKLLTG